MYEYVCYTKQGHWRFYADSDIDSMRLYNNQYKIKSDGIAIAIKA